MKNSPKSKSHKSSVSINLHQLLNKHFFLLFGITSLSLVTITSINWNRFCSTSNYSGNSISSDSLDNTNLAIENPSSFLTWFYIAIILGCSATPWLLAYLFRHRALSLAPKNLRCYPSASKAQTLKPRSLPNPVLSTSETTNSPKSAPSYRISSLKSSLKKNKSLAKKTKNIRLPFEKLK